MATIKIMLSDPNTFSYEPTSFLGREFGSFRSAMATGGARAVKRSDGSWVNLSSVASAPKVVAALQAAGFDLDMGVGTHLTMINACESAVSDVNMARARLAEIEQTLSRRGQRLYRYQREGVLALLNERSHILGDDMGLGKTLQMLCTVPDQGRALVICPALVKGGFAAEVKRWRPDLVPVILSGRGSFRWPEQGEVVITNYEILPGKSTTIGIDLGDLSRPPTGVTLLVDEIHRCGNSQTLVTARIGALAGLVLDHGGRAYGATGTLMRTAPPNIWAILGALRLRPRSFGSWANFTGAFGAYQDRFGGWTWPANCPDGAAEGLSKVMLRRTKSAVAKDLPSCTTTDLPVTVSASLLKSLDKIAARTLAKLHARKIALYAKTLDEVLDEDMQKAMADGATIGEISAVRETLAMAKLPAALEYVADMEAQKEPLLVFSAHVAVAEAIGSRPGWGLITGSVSPEARTEIVRKFQAGELLGVAGTIGAMGVGVTMTRAAQVLFVDLSWTPADNAQARDRAHRHGQERPVNVIRLVASHAIDQRIAQVLAEKIERNDSSVEAASVDENFTAPALALPAPIVIKAPPTVVPRTIEEETPIDF